MLFHYIMKRLIYIIPTLLIVSIVVFVIIQLPPGDYLTSLVAAMASRGATMDRSTIAALEARYGLGEPIYVQYWKWISGIIFRGDFGRSFEWNKPVSQLVWSRLGFSALVAISSLLFTWILSLPIGIYCAVKQYSIGDYIATFFGFLGLSVPNFLFALVLMYISHSFFGQSVGGLFSPEFIDAPFSWAKFLDFLAHLWVPMLVIGTAGTARQIRIMRANLLDELKKPYVITARSKGLSEIRLLLKYPVRIAINPFISTIGYSLPLLISGSTVVGIVLGLPVSGPLLLRALKAQDMYLAGSFILLLSTLTIIGTLISDLLLVVFDPRIRYQ